jgi:hypothetical protein
MSHPKACELVTASGEEKGDRAATTGLHHGEVALDPMTNFRFFASQTP